MLGAAGVLLVIRDRTLGMRTWYRDLTQVRAPVHLASDAFYGVLFN